MDGILGVTTTWYSQATVGIMELLLDSDAAVMVIVIIVFHDFSTTMVV